MKYFYLNDIKKINPQMANVNLVLVDVAFY